MWGKTTQRLHSGTGQRDKLPKSPKVPGGCDRDERRASCMPPGAVANTNEPSKIATARPSTLDLNKLFIEPLHIRGSVGHALLGHPVARRAPA
jgi:hypothetical protein